MELIIQLQICAQSMINTSTLQIGLAVGDTNEEKAKAEFTKLAVPVRDLLKLK